MTFTTTVPADSTGSYGIFTRDTRNGSWVLADWYPILAVWERETAGLCRRRPPSAIRPTRRARSTTWG